MSQDYRENSTFLLILKILVIISLILPNLGFSRVTPPETLKEAKEMGEKAGKEAKEKLPGILEKIWKEEVLPLWQRMYNWVKNWWNQTIWPKIESFFKKIVEPRVKEEVEKRKPLIEEEFKKEKEEIKEELPKVGKSLWERFKELIK